MTIEHRKFKAEIVKRAMDYIQIPGNWHQGTFVKSTEENPVDLSTITDGNCFCALGSVANQLGMHQEKNSEDEYNRNHEIFHEIWNDLNAVSADLGYDRAIHGVNDGMDLLAVTRVMRKYVQQSNEEV